MADSVVLALPGHATTGVPGSIKPVRISTSNLPDSGVHTQDTSQTYGSSSSYPVVNIDRYGRITGVSATSLNLTNIPGTLDVGKGGTGVTTATGTGSLVRSADASVSGAWNFGNGLKIPGNQIAEFGYGSSKEGNAGKIGYTTFSGNSLDIVGAGSSAPRLVRVWDKLHSQTVQGDTVRAGSFDMYTDGYNRLVVAHNTFTTGCEVLFTGNRTDDYGNPYGAQLTLQRINAGVTTQWSIRAPTAGNDLLFLYSVYARGYLQSTVDVTTIDFTGQHRSFCDDPKFSSTNVGMIVESTGRYRALSGAYDSVNINEALPVVKVCDTPRCKRVYGVISDKESEDDKNREYAVGAFVSVMEKPDNLSYLIINSVGEGSIWVCDANGPIENGDYVTSSPLPGYGMRQNEFQLCNFTVAKITCDCDFDNLEPWVKTRTVTLDGTVYRCAFVGCTYHCG